MQKKEKKIKKKKKRKEKNFLKNIQSFGQLIWNALGKLHIGQMCINCSKLPNGWRTWTSILFSRSLGQ